MELTFETAELRELCEKRAAATDEFGLVAARDLERCLADIDASESVGDLEVLYSEQLTTTEEGDRVLTLACGVTIRFRSGHVRTRPSTGRVEWDKVTRIRITAVEPVCV